MKKDLLLFCCIFFFFSTKAQQPLGTTFRPFITTWNIFSISSSMHNQLILAGIGKNFTVSWVNMNNASDTNSKTASIGDTITFAAKGIYKLYITPGSGTFSAITFDGFYTPLLLSIEQWGDIEWSTFDLAFDECRNMVLNAADTPDLSNVTDLSYMFFDCSSLSTNAAMNNWNTSHIKNMTGMFEYATYFNQPISGWDVSNVTNMRSMFAGAEYFNQPIGNWNVSKVTDMEGMFGGAASFNQPIGNWNVSNVKDMNEMFTGIPDDEYIGSAFNQNINSWNVSNVTDMSELFDENYVFNQPLDNWNVSNVTNMESMFGIAKSFNQPIGNWNVSNVTNMERMFVSATLFNQPIGNWNVSNVTSMEAIFGGAISFNQPIGNWNVSNVTDMGSMFSFSFNQPIGNWNVSKVTNMDYMFYDAYAFNQNIGSWNLSGKPHLSHMFDSSGMDCRHYSQTLEGWANSTTTPNGLTLGAAGLIYDSAFSQAAHDSLTNIKKWTIGGDTAEHCNVILPVNFISFTAIQQGDKALLNWIVADEINAKGYDVEKSLNGYNYNATGYINADGKQTNYTFTDNNLTSAISYYRIKEVDNDGKYIYSTVRKIEYSKFTWKINGNPVKNSSVALMLDKAANVSVQIVSSNGSVVKNIQKGNLVAGSYNIPLNIDNATAGLYLVRLMVDNKTYTATIVK